MLSTGQEPVAVCVLRSRIASSGSVRIASSRVCSVTATLASSRCIGAQKNGVRSMRQGGAHLLRPKATAGAGSVLWRQASVPGPRRPPRRLCALRQGEAGEAGLPREQSVLHQALRLLRRPSMPILDDQGRRSGAASGLAHGQGPREAGHAGAASTRRDTRTEGTRHRRDLDQEEAHLPNRGERGPFGSAERIAPRRAWTSSSSGWAPRNAGGFAWPSWTCGSRFEPRPRLMLRRPASSSTSFTCFATWAKPWIPCARASARLTGKDRRFIKGQKYTPLQPREPHFGGS